MEPHDVLLEAMAAASLKGDSALLRLQMCKKLDDAIRSLVVQEPQGGNGTPTQH